MAASAVKCKPAAILCANVVGKRCAKGDDHERAQPALTESCQAFSKKIEEDKGRVVNAPGKIPREPAPRDRAFD